MKKIAIITGASKGIGKAFAEVFARNGYSLILVARSTAELTALQSGLHQKHQTESKILSIDMTLPDAIDKIYEAIQTDLPQVEVLVNNAGYGYLGKFEEMQAADVSGMIELNISALTKLTHKLLPHMLAKKSGKILNIASTAAFAPGPYMAEYFATKAYVLSFSEALHNECQGMGVTVSALCPGATKSDFGLRSGTTKSEFSKLKKMTSEEVAEIGYQGLMADKRVIVSGFSNKMTTYMMWLLPHFISLNMIRNMMKPTKN